MPIRRIAAASLASLTLAAGLWAVLQRAAAEEQFDPARCASAEPGAMSAPWQFSRLHLEQAHEITTGEGATIGLIDTGVDTVDNPALTTRNITNYNYAEYDRTVGEDDEVDCTTGTQAAALMVADAPGFVAIAPDARLLVLRARQDGALPGTEEGDPISNYADAVRGGIEYEVDVLVITQSTQETPGYRAAVEAAKAAGIVIVAAAPIAGSSGEFPASADGVISVGATGDGDIAAPESQPMTSGQVTIAAPGDKIPTISPSGPGGAAWGTASGTSLADPRAGIHDDRLVLAPGVAAPLRSAR